MTTNLLYRKGDEMSRVSRGFRFTARFIKWLALTVVFSVIALILWRIFSSKTPKALKAMIPNEKLAAAYEEHGNDLYIFNQDQKSITTAERNRGYYTVSECYIIPEANQIQLVFRYNNSTVRSIAEDKELEEIPPLDAYLFDFSLSVQLDLTPENDTDNGGNIKEAVEYRRIKPSQMLHERKTLYNYYRYVFDFDDIGLSLSEVIESGELLAIYSDIYFCYETGVDYGETADGVLCIYDYKTDVVEQRLKARDRRAIKDFIKG